MDTHTAELAIKAANYWMNEVHVPGGQAIGTLSCGHSGPIGAPLCKECTKVLLKKLYTQLRQS